jgi:hypothetical protein
VEENRMHVRRIAAVSLALIAALVIAVTPGFAHADGNVLAYVSNMSLYVFGDDLANDIEVTQGMAPGEFVVTGSGGTSVNGAFLPVTLSGVLNDVRIQMNGGDDFVDVHDATIGRSLDVKMEMGLDTLLVWDLVVTKNATLSGGDDADQLSMGGVDVAGKLKIRGDNGDDDLGVIGVTISRNTKISGGNGNDLITASTATFDNKFVVVSSAGTDEVILEDIAITGKAGVSLGADDDHITFGGIICDGRMVLNGGAGVNTFTNNGGNDIADGPVVKNL